jgi:hypothetical protein
MGMGTCLAFSSSQQQLTLAMYFPPPSPNKTPSAWLNVERKHFSDSVCKTALEVFISQTKVQFGRGSGCRIRQQVAQQDLSGGAVAVSRIKSLLVEEELIARFKANVPGDNSSSHFKHAEAHL